MLDIEDCRRVFAERITASAAEKQSFERALMAACEYAYRRGLEDGAEPDALEITVSGECACGETVALTLRASALSNDKLGVF